MKYTPEKIKVTPNVFRKNRDKFKPGLYCLEAEGYKVVVHSEAFLLYPNYNTVGNLIDGEFVPLTLEKQEQVFLFHGLEIGDFFLYPSCSKGVKIKISDDTYYCTEQNKLFSGTCNMKTTKIDKKTL